MNATSTNLLTSPATGAPVRGSGSDAGRAAGFLTTSGASGVAVNADDTRRDGGEKPASFTTNFAREIGSTTMASKEQNTRGAMGTKRRRRTPNYGIERTYEWPAETWPKCPKCGKPVDVCETHCRQCGEEQPLAF